MCPICFIIYQFLSPGYMSFFSLKSKNIQKDIDILPVIAQHSTTIIWIHRRFQFNDYNDLMILVTPYLNAVHIFFIKNDNRDPR